MSVFQLLPIDEEDRVPFLDATYEIDDADYTLRLTWSERLGSWYADLLDADDNVLWAGRKILARYQIAARQVVAGAPAGIFFADDQDNDTTAPGFDDLGGRVKIIYADPGSFPTPPPLTDAVRIDVAIA